VGLWTHFAACGNPNFDPEQEDLWQPVDLDSEAAGGRAALQGPSAPGGLDGGQELHLPGTQAPPEALRV